MRINQISYLQSLLQCLTLQIQWGKGVGTEEDDEEKRRKGGLPLSGPWKGQLTA